VAIFYKNALKLGGVTCWT